MRPREHAGRVVLVQLRRRMLDGLGELNRRSYEQIGDPEIQTRTQQYEMEFKRQSRVPELADMSGESAATYDLYGECSCTKGSFASSALMARRLVERGVRFVQIFHRGWDQHGSLPFGLAARCKDVDQPSYGLIQDLKQRRMLDDTLVSWSAPRWRAAWAVRTAGPVRGRCRRGPIGRAGGTDTHATGPRVAAGPCSGDGRGVGRRT